MRRSFSPARVPLLASALPALLLPLAFSGCAVGGTPAPDVAPFEPTFGPAEQGSAADGTERSGGREGRPGRGQGSRGDGGPDEGARAGSDSDGAGSVGARGPRSGSGATGSGSGSGPSGGASGPSGSTPRPTSASVDDPTGDVRGVGTPAWADLSAGTLRRAGDGWTLELRMGAEVPAATSGDQVLDLTLWVDRHGDGTIDDEVLAQLGGDGWTTAYRDPDGARYGADSGVSVRSAGAVVTVTMPPTHLGGSRTLQWALGAELGSLAAMTAGTASRDTAPDAGAAAFPG